MADQGCRQVAGPAAALEGMDHPFSGVSRKGLYDKEILEIGAGAVQSNPHLVSIMIH